MSVQENVVITKEEKNELNILIDWAKKNGFKKYSEEENNNWDQEDAKKCDLCYIEGWARIDNIWFIVYSENNEFILISYGDSMGDGVDSLYEGFAGELIENLK